MTQRPFKTDYAVTREDCDNFGLINYENYFNWVNHARDEFLSFCGCGIEYLEEKGINLVTVNLNLRCMESCLSRRYY